MKLPDVVKSIRTRFLAVYPLPQGAPGSDFEETVRQWAIKFAQQVRYETGDPIWGVKRADPNRPISKDTIACFERGRLLIWDLCIGTGTGSPRLNEDPDSEDVTGQQFVGVEAKDWLPISGQGGMSNTGEYTPAPAAEDLRPALRELQGVIDGKLETIVRLGRQHLDGQTALEDAYRKLTEDFGQLAQQVTDLGVKLETLSDRPVHVTMADGRLVIGGREVGKLDFPDPPPNG